MTILDFEVFVDYCHLLLPLPTIFIFYYATSVPTTVTVELLLAVVT